MFRSSRMFASWLIAAGFCVSSSLPSPAQIAVRSVKVLGSKDVVEVEVEASDRIIPQTQLLTGPDRLVIDFPNSRPADDLHSQSVDRGEVRDLRVGLFQSKPPVTRVVLDLKSAQSFQVFPYGRTVMIKVIGNQLGNAVAHTNDASVRPGFVAANYTTNAEPVHIEAAPQPPPAPPLQVSYEHGLLGIRANKATLSEVLYAVQQRTGADIAIAAGAEQERVVAEIDPAPAPEVLARLLNGSKFNFLILSAPDDPGKLDRVILSTRAETNFNAPLPPVQNSDDDANAEEPPTVIHNQPDNMIPAQQQQVVPQQPDQPPPQPNPPDQ